MATVERRQTYRRELWDTPSSSSQPGFAPTAGCHQLIYEAVVKGIDKFPVGQERSRECALRRDELRSVLAQLSQVLAKVSEDSAKITSEGEVARSECIRVNIFRCQLVLDRCGSLLCALDELQAHDVLRCQTKSSASDHHGFSQDDDDILQKILQEYAQLETEIRVHHEIATKLNDELNGKNLPVYMATTKAMVDVFSPFLMLTNGVSGGELCTQRRGDRPAERFSPSTFADCEPRTFADCDAKNSFSGRCPYLPAAPAVTTTSPRPRRRGRIRPRRLPRGLPRDPPWSPVPADPPWFPALAGCLVGASPKGCKPPLRYQGAF